jgi:cobalt-zinc-cadmium resistance protein CzcA
VPGAEDVNVDKVTGSGQVQVKYDRKKIARYGLNISDVNTLLKMAFAGCTAGTIFEEEKRFDLVVRFDEKFRNDIDYVKKLYVPLPDGGQVTLDQLASIDIRNGTAQISRESTRRRITVSFNVRGRDVESIISELRTKIESKLKLPPGYYITYGGQFENLVAAKERLSIAVPFALLLIFILLFFTFRSVRNSLLIFSAVPLSAIGGVFALYLRDMNFSISAGVGFIALFGVSVLNGIVLISEFNRLGREEGIYDIYERVRKGIKIRLRPVIITAAVASLGFLPMAISTSPGSEVQKPLATVVIGGLISSSLLTLIILPVLYIIFSSGKKLMWCKPGKSMITTTIIFVILISSVFINKATAQENITLVYTLEQAINRALSENGYIKSAELHVEMQKKLKTAAWETTSTDFGYIYGQTNSILRDNNFSITQSFRFPGINKTKLRLGDANIRYSEAGMLLSRAEVISEVKITYFNVLYINSLISLLGYRDSLFTEFARAAELKVQNGESPPLEKAAAQTRLMEVRSLVRQAEADLLIYQRKMQLLLNEKKPVSIFDKELKKTDISISNDSSALAGNALIEMFRQQAEMSRIETIIEKLKLLPEFSLGYFNQSNREINPYMRFTGVQAGLSVPLIFFPKTAKVQSLIINEKIAHVNYEYNRAKIFSQYNESVQEYLKKKARLEYYEESAIPQADLIIGQSEKSFKAGNIDYVEFIFTINQAMEIKAGYLHTLLEYNMTIIAIEKLTCKIN